jgi:chorismate mutase
MSTADVLRGRIEALSQEIRNYPTPIARCDEQLTLLLDERARLMAQLASQEHEGDTNAA